MTGFSDSNKIISLKRIESDASKYFDKVCGNIKSRINNKWSKSENTVNTDNVKEADFVKDYKVVFKPCSPALNLTNDSGITSCKDDSPSPKPLKRKLHFSSKNNIITEIDSVANFEKFHSSTPNKSVKSVSEVPQTTNPQNKNAEVLTKEVLQAINVNRDAGAFTKPEDLFQSNISNNTFVRSPNCKSVDEKFIVNVYESRPSKRWKKQNICLKNSSKIFIMNESRPEVKTEPENHNSYINVGLDRKESAMFDNLKRLRNVECVKMTQASNILKTIKLKPSEEWAEELLAERILLEADEKYKLIVNKMREVMYPEMKPEKSKHQGTITLSNFQYALKPQEVKNNKYSEFFVLFLSDDRQLLMSKVMEATNDKLAFDDNFTFKNVDSDFKIKAQVFSITIKTNGRTSNRLSKRKNPCKWCPMSRIYYQNIINELKESRVLITSFVSRAEAIITREDIGKSSLVISKIPEDSQIKNTMKFSLTLDDLKINANLSGFLTLGLPNKNDEILYWDRKWCTLNGTHLSIFNFPSEEYFGQPIFTIDLRDCLIPLIMNQRGCLKKKNFLLKVGSTFINEIDADDLGKQETFSLKKYVFSADTNEDLKRWTKEIRAILDCLRDWGKLTYGEDDY